MQVNFLGQTYPSYSTNINASRAINLFPEVNTSDSASPISMFGTPGTTLFASTSGQVVRGMRAFNEVMFIVAGQYLYSVSPVGTVSGILGTLQTNYGPVSMNDNGISSAGIGGNQLIITDGMSGYIYNILTGVFSIISGGWWPGATGPVTYIDGYFVTHKINSMSYGVSNLYDGTTWSALATSPVQASSDNIKCCINSHQQLLFIKSYTTEIWYDSGTATSVGSPFSRLSGGVADFGTEAPFSPAIGDNSFFLLGSVRNQDSGQVSGIVEFNGSNAVIVSPSAINQQISMMGVISDAIGYCYSDMGRTFYVLSFPSEDRTFVYDALTKMCHERSSYLVGDSVYKVRRHVGNCYCYFNRKHYIGDWQNGNIYEMNKKYFTDNGNPIVSVRIAQPLSMVSYSPTSLITNEDTLFCKSLVVEAETGVGDYNLINQTGIDPQANLSWSDDGGHSWSSQYPVSLGPIGNYSRRLEWRRLGRFRKRYFCVSIDAPVKKVLINGFVDIQR